MPYFSVFAHSFYDICQVSIYYLYLLWAFMLSSQFIEKKQTCPRINPIKYFGEKFIILMPEHFQAKKYNVNNN